MKNNFKIICTVVLLTTFMLSMYTTALAANNASIDYEALFEKGENIDGYLAEAYYLEVSQIFDAAPREFVEALSKQPLNKILDFSESLYFEHRPSADSYNLLLDDMILTAPADSALYDTLFLMRMVGLCVETTNVDPNAFENRHHQKVQAYYQENSRLFMLVLTDYCSSDFAEALVFGLDTTELESLDAQLAADAAADWATDEIKGYITVIRDQIDTILNPPPPVTEPPVTEPAVTEPTTPPATTVPEATETVPSDTSSEQPKDTNNTGWIIAIIAITVLLIAGTVFMLTPKRKK